MSGRLPKSFYARDPRVVARELLNKVLVYKSCAVRLVEVEAYLGEKDPASHAFRGETNRNAVMFGPPGFLYVYFTYGMHWCMNVVCETDGVAGAVLLRAGEPLKGLPLMRRRRGITNDKLLASGPARLTQSLGINRTQNGISLLTGPCGIFDDGVACLRPRRSERIGLRNGVEHQWRWYVRGNPNVSGTNRQNS